MTVGTEIIFLYIFSVIFAACPVTKIKKKCCKHTFNILGIALFKYRHILD